MILTADEIQWVSDKLDTYEIKFQEIYDELKDHILTAIENARHDGDTQPIDVVYTKVIKAQFPGYWPFEDIVKQCRVNYHRKVQHIAWVNFKRYFNWQTLPVIVLLMVASFYIPQTKIARGTMATLLFVVTVTPSIYIWWHGRRIKTDKGKESMVKGYVYQTANIMICVFNLLFNCISFASREWNSIAFMNPRNYSPVVFMVMVILAVVYGLSCIKLSKQEFKIAV